MRSAGRCGRDQPQLELLQVELAGLRVRGLRDGEILDREPSRVEQRDVAGTATAVGVSDENCAEVGDVVPADHACGHRRGELAAVARLLPVVAKEVSTAELFHRDLSLSGPVGPHERDVLAGLE